MNQTVLRSFLAEYERQAAAELAKPENQDYPVICIRRADINPEYCRKQARQRTRGRIVSRELPSASDQACFDCGRVWREGDPPHQYDHYLGYAPEHHDDVQPVCRTCHTSREVARGVHRQPHKKNRAGRT